MAFFQRIDRDHIQNRQTNYSLTQLSETEQTACVLNVIFIRILVCPYQATGELWQNFPADFETSWDGVTRYVAYPETLSIKGICYRKGE
jgi:hypothetical protein